MSATGTPATAAAAGASASAECASKAAAEERLRRSVALVDAWAPRSQSRGEAPGRQKAAAKVPARRA